MNEFEHLRMKDSDTIDSFSGKLLELAAKSAFLGQTLEESKLVNKFLNSLPRSKYIHIIPSVEQVLDLNKTTYEDIIGRLKAYEERILDEETHEPFGNLLYANSNKRTEKSRGRGRGRGQGNTGRGRGRSNTRDISKEKKDYSNITCFKCDKKGQFASVCPEKKDDQELNKQETKEADVVYMHEIVFLNEEKVLPKAIEQNNREEGMPYLDNGASNHMTGERSYFYELSENIKGKVVKFGDGSCVDINGK